MKEKEYHKHEFSYLEERVISEIMFHKFRQVDWHGVLLPIFIKSNKMFGDFSLSGNIKWDMYKILMRIRRKIQSKKRSNSSMIEYLVNAAISYNPSRSDEMPIDRVIDALCVYIKNESAHDDILRIESEILTDLK